MTTEDPGPGREHMADVVPLRAESAHTEADFAETPAPADADTTGAGTPRPPSPPLFRPGAAGGGDGDRRLPIIPEHLRRDRIRQTVGETVGLYWYKFRVHAVRSPLYAAKMQWYALRGVFRLGGQLLAWANWADGWVLESLAVAAGRSGHHDAMNAHTQGRKTRATRWQITGVCFVLVVAVLLAMVRWLPWWGWAAFTMTAVAVLSRHGAPEGQRIVRAAVVPTAYQPPTPEVLTRALGSLGITAINQVIKDGPGISFVSDVHRDGDGWGVELDLPHGVTASDIIRRREALASGLRRPHSATWPEAVPHEHAGRLYLWIGRHDLSKTKPVPYPLLKTGTADVFAQVPFAVTPRGQGVGAPLFETNHVYGAAPGQGKTTTVRVVNCGAALDVVCDLWIHELAGAGDLEPLAQVCYRYVSGLDDEAIAYVAESCRKLRAEVDHRGPALKALPREVRPDGKLTRDLATQRRLRLRPICATFDEIQNATMHPKYGPQIIEDLAYVMRLGRKLGIFIILSTQRPDAGTLPPKIRDLATVRFCLKVPDQPSNDMILGTGSYHAGYRASEFRPKIDAGLGWFKGEGDPQAVRTYYLDLNDTARIAARARAMREAAGVLSGYALGETPDEDARSFAADVLTIFGDADKLHCATITTRLREHLTGVYADITQEAVSSQLTAVGITVKKLRETGRDAAPGVRAGCERAAVEAVAQARETGDA
jgi:S-DNA-T family DNA segregation ATPase FtsK/SpoIIIE